MAVPLADNACFDRREVLRTLLVGIDLYRDSVRHLLVQRPKRLLADDLSGQLPHILIGDDLLIIILRPLGKSLQDCPDDFLDIESPQRRYNDDVAKCEHLLPRFQDLRGFLFVDRIDLVDDEDHRLLLLFELLRNIPVTVSDVGRRLDQPENDVRIADRLVGHIDEILTELIVRLSDHAGRIEKDDLAFLSRKNCLYSVPGRLRPVTGNRDLLTDQMIHKCGFSHVRPSDYDRISRFIHSIRHLSSVSPHFRTAPCAPLFSPRFQQHRYSYPQAGLPQRRQEP